jgi:hypothetical protein
VARVDSGTMVSRFRLTLVVTAMLAACEHGAPFRPGDYGPDGPFGTSSPTRLTLNPGEDLTPTWLADGDGILYSAERLDRADTDHCLGELPPNGGVVRRWACRTSAPDDSINVLENPAVGGDGGLVYVRASGSLRIGRPLGPSFRQLVLAPLAAPAAPTRVLLSIPTPAPGGRTYDAISHVTWLSPTRVAYLEETVRYPRPCSSCAPDTVRTGTEIVTLDFAGAASVLAVVPSTDSASSVAVGATGDTIYFTRNGDTRVYRYTFSSGQRDTVHDFALAGIARDAVVANGRLIAVVGGDVTYVVDSVLGASQVDRGGELHVVTLATGAETIVGGAGGEGGEGGGEQFRRPAFAPGGTRVVVERWTGGGPPDLWLLDVP